MEKVKDEPVDAPSSREGTAPGRPEWFARLLAWRGSTAERVSDRDPTFWMHRDVTI